MKKLKRTLSFIGVISFVFLAGIFSLILFPQPLFSNSYEYQNFKVFTNQEIDQNAFNQSLAKAQAIVSTSELYDANFKYDIFLAHNTSFNKIDNVILGRWSAARSISNNIIIKRAVSELEQTVANGDNQFDLVYVLVHEMVHCLQHNKYGLRRFNPLLHPPMWKLEGYPEYMSRRELLESDNYDLKKAIQFFLSRTADAKSHHQIIQIAEKESTPYIYYKGRLMTEYLLDIKGLSYDDLLKEEIKEVEVYQEMLNWAKEK